MASLLLGAMVGVLFWGISKNLGIALPYLWTAPLLFPVLAFIGTWVAFFSGKRIPVLFQAAKFLEVGALNTFVDLGVLNLLLFLFQMSSGLAFSLFKGISFAVAVLNSYFWNKHWTFKTKEENTRKEFTQFLLVSITGFLVNVGVASVVVNLIGPQFEISQTLWANIGALIATVAAMTWNFLGYKLIVFR